MAYNFKNLADVEMLDIVPEESSVLIETNGQIRRAPGEGLGGEKIKTLKIKISIFDDLVHGNPVDMDTEPTFSANMTFDEVVGAFINDELPDIMYIDYFVSGFNTIVPSRDMIGSLMYYGNGDVYVKPCIRIDGWCDSLFWTAEDGISWNEPEYVSSGK